MTVHVKDKIQTEFKIEDLEKSLFALGDFFVERSSHSSLKLHKAGDLLDARQLEKIKKAKHSRFRFVPLTHSDFIEEGISLWEKFKVSKDEEERKNLRLEILRWFSSVYWSGERKGSLLDLIHVHEKVFWRFEKPFVEKYWNCSTMLFKRSALLSSLVTPLALACGYLDFKYLSDVCHASFLVDCSFEQANFSYLISQTFEEDRQKSEESRIKLLDQEKNLYLSHPQLSYEKASVECAKYLNDKTVLGLILRHHEKTTGEGWPKHLAEGEFSDIENLLISLNQILPYDDRDYTENDGASFLRDLASPECNVELASLPVRRLEGLLKSVFETPGNLKMAQGA